MGGGLGDEAVVGTQVHQGGELVIANHGGQLEVGVVRNANDGMDRHPGPLLGIVVERRVIGADVEEVDTLARAHLGVIFRELLREVKKHRPSRRRWAISSRERRLKRSGGGGTLTGAPGVLLEPNARVKGGVDLDEACDVKLSKAWAAG